MSNNILPFGKYKGEGIVEVASKDPNYIEWLKTQAWLKDDFKQQIINININGGLSNGKHDSPEHNKLQFEISKYGEYFFDLNSKKKPISKTHNIDFEKKEFHNGSSNYSYIDLFFNFKSWSLDENKLKKFETAKIYSKQYLLDNDIHEHHCYEKRDEEIFNLKSDTNLKVKEVGVDSKDYYVKAYGGAEYDRYCHYTRLKDFFTQRNHDDFIFIEIKPSLGEDFMNHIREIEKYKVKDELIYERNINGNVSARPHYYLVYDKFEINSLSLDEVKSIFLIKNIKLISLEEIKK